MIIIRFIFHVFFSLMLNILLNYMRNKMIIWNQDLVNCPAYAPQHGFQQYRKTLRQTYELKIIGHISKVVSILS